MLIFTGQVYEGSCALCEQQCRTMFHDGMMLGIICDPCALLIESAEEALTAVGFDLDTIILGSIDSVD